MVCLFRTFSYLKLPCHFLLNTKKKKSELWGLNIVRAPRDAVVLEWVALFR